MNQRVTKTPKDSEIYLAEIVGEESRFGHRLSAGPLLHLMDLAAATAAGKHSQTPVVTVAFDRIELLDTIYHMDYVRYEACVIRVGRSSMVAQVSGYARPATELELSPIHSGIITMVAVDSNKSPDRNIPKLEYLTKTDLEKKKLADQREEELQKDKALSDELKTLQTVDNRQLIDPVPKRHHLLAPEKSLLHFQKLFLPRHTNSLGIIFGGEIIELMEELAIACARHFTGNFHVVTIAMEDILFIHPLYLKQLVELESTVTFVGVTTLVVNVTVKAYSLSNPDECMIANKGTFTILNFDHPRGEKKPIMVGLDINEMTLEQKKCYLKELTNYHQRKEKSNQ